MYIHELILPFYCPVCKSITFIYKRKNRDVIYCDFNDGEWSEHPCGITNADVLRQSEYILNISNVEWGCQNIQYRTREKQQKTSTQRFTAGIILSITKSPENRIQCSVLNLETFRVITVEIKNSDESLSAGMLLNMEKATRIGSEKYRLQKVEQIRITNIASYRSAEGKEQYRL